MKPVLIAIGGSIGSGKTTLGYKLQKYWYDKYQQACSIVEDDTERRIYLGYQLKDRMKPEDYSERISAIMIQHLAEKTASLIKEGKCVIRCLTRNNQMQYQSLKVTAEQYSANFIGIFLVASEENIRARIQRRLQERQSSENLSVEMGHASDADEGVLKKFPIPNFVPDGWLAINADQSPEQVFEELKSKLA